MRSGDSPAVRPESQVITLSRQSIIDDGVGLDRVWCIICRRWRIIAGFVASALIIAVIVLSLMTPLYTAKSTLLIEPEAPQVLDVKELMNASGDSQEHDYYRTQFELLHSRDLAGRVISELGLMQNATFNSVDYFGRLKGLVLAPFASLSGGTTGPATPSDAESRARYDATNHYLAGLTISPVAGTRLVTVSYSAPSRALAARIVDRHVHDFIKMGIELRAQAGKSARDFLASQLVEIGQRVQDSEARLNTYRHREGIIAFGLDEKNSIAAERMTDLNKALIAIDTKRLTAEEQMKLVQAHDLASLPQVVTNPAITALTTQVRSLQAEYARLAASFNPGYPKLDEAKAQMDAAQRALTSEMEDVAKSVERTYIATDAEEKKLQAEIDAEKAKDLAVNDASLRDAVLVREVETNRQLFKNVLQRMQEVDVSQRAPLSNISILDDAVAGHSPSEPKKLRDLCIAALMSAMIGVGIAFFADQRDDRLHTLEELEDFLHLPALAMVPDFSRLGSSTAGSKALNPPTSMLLGHAKRSNDNGRANTTEHCRQSYVAGTAETYRMIRTSLLFSRAGSPPRSIAVCSAIKGEGKTSTVANTALVFAHTGTRTLLIDADLRRPNCHSVMNETNHRGLSDVLTGQASVAEVIRATTVDNLFLLTAGSPAPNPAELLTSSRMCDLISEFSEEYGVIMIDTAPLMLASDTAALATMVDGVVLVAGAATSKNTVQRAYRRLEYVGAKVLGVVLNRVDIHGPGHQEYRSYYLSYGEYETGA